MRLGDLEIFHLSDGRFRLDGGAMFGVVPKVLWEKSHPADERNRIVLDLGVLLIRAQGKNILVDTGIGDKQDARTKDLFGIEHRPSLQESLGTIGLESEDIDIVINTHLHFDHAGGNTRQAAGRELAPSFPRARYLVQKGEWAAARSGNERTRKSYDPDDFLPLEGSGRIILIDGDEEIVPGVRLLKTPGHTEHHQSVMIESGGERAIFLGDLIPTASHLPLPYIMAYDILPLVTLETKRRLLQQALRERWILIFQHDARVRMGRVTCADGKFSAVPVDEYP